MKRLLLVAALLMVGCALWRDAPAPETGPTAPEPERTPVAVSKPKPTSKPEPENAAHCVMSDWSEFTPWGQWVPVPDFEGWEMRVRIRSRSQIAPAEKGGKPCGQLMDAQTEFRWVGGQ